ncbi:hypothetical protein FLL45_22215 [Aliikangiella marina]|uniref:ADP,ATP carrier protein n=1 Tax=Aliikangiella marina TaxID=1712262 RepID=A0A545T1E9_9GAMM|nr:putative Ig domain-containing protein [Aliikangiella marina]TQV71044.1 hypothetical protein FLL45_22215 [Aliikangiella marina]
MANRLHFGEKLLSVATRIRPGEGPSTWMLIGNAFFLLYSHYLLKVVRETLILTNGSAMDKSLANAISALTIGFVVFVYGIFYKHYQDKSHRYGLTVMVNGFFFVNILIFLGLIAIDIKTPMVFYVWQSIYGVLLVSHFWSYCADLMNQKTGQRLFPPIMIGATLGAWFGSLSADWVYGQAGINSVLFAAVICLVGATYLSMRAELKLPEESKNHKIDVEDQEEHISALEGFRLIFSKKYLIYVAAFVLLMNWINTTGEFIFASYVKDTAAAIAATSPNLSEADLITRYYSTYYTWVSSLGFLLQTFLVARLFRWIGIKGSVLILPVVMILGYGLLALVPIFIVAFLTMIAENSASYSIANTTRNALYLPLDRDDKYLAKTTIDTFVWRLGDLLQFGVIYVGLNSFNWETMEFVWLNLALSALMLLICYKISKTYGRDYEDSQTGNAPQIIGEIANFELSSGFRMRSKIPEDLFYDPDPGDALRYFLTTVQNTKLPEWIVFDKHNLHITFHPPKGTSGELKLKLRVTDADELGCEVEFDVRWSDSLPMSPHLERI